MKNIYLERYLNQGEKSKGKKQGTDTSKKEEERCNLRNTVKMRKRCIYWGNMEKIRN